MKKLIGTCFAMLLSASVVQSMNEGNLQGNENNRQMLELFNNPEKRREQMTPECVLPDRILKIRDNDLAQLVPGSNPDSALAFVVTSLSKFGVTVWLPRDKDPANYPKVYDDLETFLLTNARRVANASDPDGIGLVICTLTGAFRKAVVEIPIKSVAHVMNPLLNADSLTMLAAPGEEFHHKYSFDSGNWVSLLDFVKITAEKK